MTGSADLRSDIAIVGGGLAGGLAALALAQRRPDLDVRVVERGPIGGNHVWSWFDSDIAPANRWILAPLAHRHWDSYDIAFPAHARTLSTGYNSTSGTALDAAVRAALLPERIIAEAAVSLETDRVALANQSALAARHVLDARGSGDFSMLTCGWQKFLGQRLTVAGGHGLVRPMVMDATVDQLDGYRFVYCLPFDADTVFVEDTYYSDTRDFDPAALRQRIADYAAARGWPVTAVDGEEMGALPVVMAGDFNALWPADDGVARIGVRAGVFQATTGYSLPDAVRFAALLVEAIDAPDLAGRLRAFAVEAWRRQRFYRMLDMMLFRAGKPEERYRILERFYRLRPALIERFYAGQSTSADKLRILSGKPPVPFWRAVNVIRGFKWV